MSIVDELHAENLNGHFGRNKTLALVQANFFWPKLEKDVAKFVAKCTVCILAKTRSQSSGLYTPLPVPNALRGRQFKLCCGVA